MTTEETYPTAGFVRRILALIYDALVVFALLILASALGTGVGIVFYGEQAVIEEHLLYQNPVFFSWILFCWFYYYFYCWSKTGQTLAMKAWRLKLVSNDGQEIQMHQALIRFFSGFLGLSNLTTILSSRWALHDKLSGTRLIVLPKGH